MERKETIELLKVLREKTEDPLLKKQIQEILQEDDNKNMDSSSGDQNKKWIKRAAGVIGRFFARAAQHKAIDEVLDLFDELDL